MPELPNSIYGFHSNPFQISFDTYTHIKINISLLISHYTSLPCSAMDIASSSLISTLNVFPSSISQKLANPVALIPLWPTKKSKFIFTCCSTKPGKTQNSSTGSNNLSSNSQNQSPSISSNSLSSNTSTPPSLSRGLVFDLGPENSWDSKEIGSPVVKRFLSDEEERWYMWYHGNSSESSSLDSIGLAVSNNGIHWERGLGNVQSNDDVGLVMNCSQDWWAFDTISIRPSEVVIMSSSKVRASSAVYWLYYTGFSSESVDFVDEFKLQNPERFYLDNENDRKVFKSLPGLAISQDGRHWARIEGEHHSGALFDVGLENEWDSLFIGNPQVVFHGNGDLRMYYHSFDVENGEFSIGIARSRDGMKWVKLGKIMGGGKRGSFDEFGVMNANVVKSKKDGKYIMAYEGVGGNGKRSIGLAISPNGLKDWRRFGDGEVLKASENDGWDSKGVGSPCLVQMEGEIDEWRLYYRGVSNEGRTGIGMAFCDGNDISSFKRWTGFQL